MDDIEDLPLSTLKCVQVTVKIHKQVNYCPTNKDCTVGRSNF